MNGGPKPAFHGRLALAVVRGYRTILSPWLPPACRFIPTCSEYAGEAIEKYGLIGGTRRAVRRVLRCHPLHAGGPDPLE